MPMYDPSFFYQMYGLGQQGNQEEDPFDPLSFLKTRIPAPNLPHYSQEDIDAAAQKAKMQNYWSNLAAGLMSGTWQGTAKQMAHWQAQAPTVMEEKRRYLESANDKYRNALLQDEDRAIRRFSLGEALGQRKEAAQIKADDKASRAAQVKTANIEIDNYIEQIGSMGDSWAKGGNSPEEQKARRDEFNRNLAALSAKVAAARTDPTGKALDGVATFGFNLLKRYGVDDEAARVARAALDAEAIKMGWTPEQVQKHNQNVAGLQEQSLQAQIEASRNKSAGTGNKRLDKIEEKTATQEGRELNLLLNHRKDLLDRTSFQGDAYKIALINLGYKGPLDLVKEPGKPRGLSEEQSKFLASLTDDELMKIARERAVAWRVRNFGTDGLDNENSNYFTAPEDLKAIQGVAPSVSGPVGPPSPATPQLPGMPATSSAPPVTAPEVTLGALSADAMAKAPPSISGFANQAMIQNMDKLNAYWAVLTPEEKIKLAAVLKVPVDQLEKNKESGLRILMNHLLASGRL